MEPRELAVAMSLALLVATDAIPAEGRQLNANEIRERVVGWLVKKEAMARNRGGGVSPRVLYLQYRPDGSVREKCERYIERRGSWINCTGGSNDPLVRGWTVGTWWMKGNLMCVRFATDRNADKRPRCFGYYDREGQFYSQRLTGPVKAYDPTDPSKITILKSDKIECVGRFKSGSC